MSSSQETQERNWLVSVLFMDIVGYSRHSVEQQMVMKRLFNEAIAGSLSGVSESDRVILDTGDGAAICFLADPDHAIKSILFISDALHVGNKMATIQTIIRSGINLGPVRLVNDINGRLNAVGDGINVGQRIMSFAGDGEVTVSHSFVEAAGRLREGYTDLFQDRGMKHDKHKRGHHVYILKHPNLNGHHSDHTLFSKSLPKEVWDDCQNLLAQFVGPIASVIIRNSARSHRTEAELVEHLVNEIADAKDRKHFQSKLEALLKSHLGKSDSKGHSSSGAAGSLDPNQVKLAERSLVSFLGPVAKVIVQRAATSSQTLDAFHQELATHISNEKERAQFFNLIKKEN